MRSYPPRLTGAFTLGFLVVSSAWGESPSASQALKLSPVQKDVNYDKPQGEEAEKCSIEVEKSSTASGWVVKGPNGLILRRFRDTNKDNVVDQWCYYHGGVEVYRDVDADYDGKADHFRWFGPEGVRWGLDENEDGVVDSWKAISAEEVSAEVVRALAKRDAAKFARLALTPAELKELGLAKDQQEQIGEKLKELSGGFAKLISGSGKLDENTTWVRFDALRPGTIPAGANGSTKDLTVYENVVALIETEGDHRMLGVGTLIQVGDAWRVIDVPKLYSADSQQVTSSGFFFRATPNTGDGGAGLL
ncbi:MAG: hypothetical protein N2C14_06545, partial [Planctomycetales bacterium]